MTALDGLARSMGDYPSGGDALFVDGLEYSLTGGNVFLEALPQQPDVCVALKSYGGPPPDSGLPYDSPIIQILVRGDEDPKTATDLWYAIYSVLHGAVNVDLPDGTRLVAALVQQSAPINIGPDANGRHRFSMNVRLEVVNATAHRPAPE